MRACVRACVRVCLTVMQTTVGEPWFALTAQDCPVSCVGHAMILISFSIFKVERIILSGYVWISYMFVVSYCTHAVHVVTTKIGMHVVHS